MFVAGEAAALATTRTLCGGTGEGATGASACAHDGSPTRMSAKIKAVKESSTSPR